MNRKLIALLVANAFAAPVALAQQASDFRRLGHGGHRRHQRGRQGRRRRLEAERVHGPLERPAHDLRREGPWQPLLVRPLRREPRARRPVPRRARRDVRHVQVPVVVRRAEAQLPLQRPHALCRRGQRRADRRLPAPRPGDLELPGRGLQAPRRRRSRSSGSARRRGMRASRRTRSPGAGASPAPPRRAAAPATASSSSPSRSSTRHATPLVEGGYNTRVDALRPLVDGEQVRERQREPHLDERIPRQWHRSHVPRGGQPLPAARRQRHVPLPAAGHDARGALHERRAEEQHRDRHLLPERDQRLEHAERPQPVLVQRQDQERTFSVSAASTPAQGLDTRLYYNYRERDDDSSVITFATGETTEPFSYEKNNWGLDAYYRVNRGNRVGAGYDYLDTEREGRHDFDRTKDKRFFAEWRNTSWDDLAARLKYTRLERDSNFLQGNDGANPNDSAYLNRFVTDVRPLERRPGPVEAHARLHPAGPPRPGLRGHDQEQQVPATTRWAGSKTTGARST